MINLKIIQILQASFTDFILMNLYKPNILSMLILFNKRNNTTIHRVILQLIINQVNTYLLK